MDYKAKDIKSLLSIIRRSSDEESFALLSSFSRIRYSDGLESGWEKCNDLHRKSKAFKDRESKKINLEEDDCGVEIHSFNQFVFFILDSLTSLGETDLKDEIIARIGNVRLNRRLSRTDS